MTTTPDPPPGEELGARYRIYGHVQGVGFRWWTLSEARRRGIRGSVRNVEDGSVEVVAVGPPEAIAAFRQTLHQGPVGSSVTRVVESALPDTDLPTDFHILP